MLAEKSPFFRAIIDKNVAKAKELLEAGASVKELQSEVTLLAGAVTTKCVPMVELLLDHGADPNVPSGSLNGHRHTPLIMAADRALLPIVKLLLSRGANVNAQGRDGDSALHRAVSDKTKNHFKVMEELIKAGADVNLLATAASPLMEASRSGSPEMMIYLINHGANVNIDTFVGTPLHYSLGGMDGPRAENVKVLLDHGADVNALKDDESALDLAKKSKSRKVIKLIEEAMSRGTRS